jgi:hypothetical protein
VIAAEAICSDDGVTGLARVATGWDATICATAGADPEPTDCVVTVALGLRAAAGADPAAVTDGTGCAMAEPVMGAGVEAWLVGAEAGMAWSLVSPCPGSASGTDGPAGAVICPVRASAVGAVIEPVAVPAADGGGEVGSPRATVVGGVGDVGSAIPPATGAPAAATFAVAGDVGDGTTVWCDGACAVTPGAEGRSGADRPETASGRPTAVAAGGLEAATVAWTTGLRSRRTLPASTSARPWA